MEFMNKVSATSLFLVLLFIWIVYPTHRTAAGVEVTGKTVYDFTVKDAEGKQVELKQYKGKVLIIANVASTCGFTKNGYKMLVDLHGRLGEKGLEVLAFPSNSFGQEMRPVKDIVKFAQNEHFAKFPIFGKVEVNGKEESKLYAYLKTMLPGVFGTKAVKWNFTYFLIDRNGVPVKRFGPTAPPATVEEAVRKLL